MKLVVFVFLLFNSICSISQLKYRELSGVIKINDTLFIPYELYLNRSNSTDINGYSITDKNGAHETKSAIKGSYNSINKTLKFNEFDILYTKSSFKTFDFCFIHFEGKIKGFENLKALNGNFYGKYENGVNCIDGKLILINKSKIESRTKKLEKKLNKSKYNKLRKNIKPKLDSIKLENIVANENLNVFVKSKTYTLSIYDSGKIDNDRINLFIDNELILENYSIKKEKKEIPLNVKKSKVSVKVVALNVGSSPPNTVKIEIMGENQFIETRTMLKEKESALLTLIPKKKPEHKN